MGTATNETPELLTLFGQDAADVTPGTKFDGEHIALELIEEDPDQPRQEPDDELLDLVKLHGVRKPIIVTPAPADAAEGVTYRILDGARRYLAAIKAGHTSIPAVVDRRAMTPLQRLVLQAALNASKPLDMMDEARMFNRLKEEGKLSDQQIADICKRKKSTVSDRLALINMPEAFQRMILDGLLSASAAPIIRRYLGVPSHILALAARTAPADLEWEAAKKAGKPVELDHVARVLEQIILKDEMRELPEHLVLLYQAAGGRTCKVAGVEYAYDVPKFTAAQTQYAADQRRASAPADTPMKSKVFQERPAAAAGSGGSAKEPPRADHRAQGTDDDDEDEDLFGKRTVPASTVGLARATPSAAERKRQAQLDKERAAEEEQKATWKRAIPRLLEAIAAAIKIAPTGSKSALAEYLLENVCNSRGVDLVAVTKLLPRGDNAQDLVRFMTMILLHTDLVEGFNDAGFPRVLRELGLKVDVPKILEETRKAAAAATPAKATTRSAGTPKRGGRPLTPPAPTARAAKNAKGAKPKAGKKSAPRKGAKKGKR